MIPFSFKICTDLKKGIKRGANKNTAASRFSIEKAAAADKIPI